VETAEPTPAQARTDRGTRERVRRRLLERGPATAADLGAELGLSPAAIRRHLDPMLAEGLIAFGPARRRGPRGRGRPARVFSLTEAGHAGGPSAYDDLAAGALRFLTEVGGAGAVERFARGRADDLQARLQRTVEGTAAGDRPAALAGALTAAGYAADVSFVVTGTQLCQHHCPVAHVAREFPQLCDAETDALGRLLGSHVQRLATIAHGDGVCTTHIPAPAPAGLGSTIPSGRNSS
jgi:predicted ArsR family transcriptional regulator